MNSVKKGIIMKCIIKLIWSEDEMFWYSKSLNDEFGLTLESGSLDVLIERVKTAVPDILNEIGFSGEVDLSFELDRPLKFQAVAS
jgi:hypothetical protein